MFQKFFTHNLATKFIKNLLATTNIPNAKLWKPGDIIIKYLYYFNDEGYLAQAIENLQETSNISFYDDRYFQIIQHYIPNEYIPNITSTYISNSNNYDSLTHYNLGKYLRFLKDYNKLDLMSFYNCWCGEYSTSIQIEGNNIKDNPAVKSIYKTFLIPIVYNKEYSIFYNSEFPVKIAPIYYDGVSIIDLATIDSYAQGLATIDHISFSKPYVYKGYIPSDPTLKLKEDYLYLILQVPASNKSGLVVLEGNYSDLALINKSTESFKYNKTVDVTYGYKTQIDAEHLSKLKTFGDLSEYDKQKYFITYPELLRLSDNNYAFSDRLIEFLLLNVIDKQDNISDNIKRVQKYISDNDITKWNRLLCWDINQNDYKIKQAQPYIFSYTPGIWDINMRKYLYDLTKHNLDRGTSFDITGYVDKDTEYIITRGVDG